MSVILVSTGVQFPDGSIQTVAAAGMVPTTLWSGNSSNANLTTSQSMANFDFIGLFGGGSHQGHTLYPAAAYIANTYKIHSLGHLFCSYDTTHFWHKAVSATVLNVNGGNTTCRHIVGYKLG